MMKKEIKDIFQQQYSDYSTEVDTNKLMAAIDRKRQGKKKRNYLFFFPLGLLAMVISVSVYFSFNSKVVVDSDTIVNSDLITKKEQALLVAPKKEKSHEGKGNSDTEELAKVGSEIQIPEKINIQAINTKSNDQNLSNLKTIKIKNAAAVKESKSISIVPENNSLMGSTKAIIERPVASLNSRESIETYYSDRTAAFSSKERGNKSTISLSKDKVNALDALQLLAYQELRFERALLELKPLNYNSEPTVNEVCLPENRWSASVIGGVLPFIYSSATLEKEKAVKPLRSISASLLLEYKLSKNLSIATGLEYAAITELFEWEDEYITDSNGDYFGQVDPDYIPDSFIGSRSADIYFNLVEVKLKTYNDYQLINLPLYLQYQLVDGKTKWKLYAMGSINVHQSSNGYLLNDNNQHAFGIPEMFSSSSYLSKLSWGGGIQLEFNLVNSIHFLSQLGIEMRQLNEKDSGALLLPKLQFGIGYKFN